MELGCTLFSAGPRLPLAAFVAPLRLRYSSRVATATTASPQTASTDTVMRSRLSFASTEPRTRKQAMADDAAGSWMAVKRTEIANHNVNDSWTLIDRSQLLTASARALTRTPHKGMEAKS
eukprot:1366685-Pleurochrysis_carterae.AAC.2